MKKITLLATMFFGIITSSAQVVSTLAGSTTSGFVDGIGVSAKFNFPNGVCTDTSGNFYVVDTNNQKIRKITPTGMVSTLPGSFIHPQGICIDPSGNVYVAESTHNHIIKITPAGVVSTFAGSMVDHGYRDGLNALFYRPFGIASDTSGNIYVADYSNNMIRKIDPTGVVSTFAGSGVVGYADGTAGVARFNSPTGVAVDTSGNVYVADYSNHAIRKITPAGFVTTLAGDPYQGSGNTDGIGTDARFYNPFGVCTDASGNIYVADNNNHTVRKITPTGVVGTLGGFPNSNGYVDGYGSAVRFYNPRGVCTDALGNVFVADSNNNMIRKIHQCIDYSATISYIGSAFCKNLITPQNVTLMGTGSFTGGVFSSTAGLSIDSITGTITPSTSYSGTYTIIYTALANDQCVYSATTQVTILDLPIVNISADGVVATSTTITNGSSVPLQLNGTFNAVPNIQWTPAIAISSATVANPVVYPSVTTTYTASFVNSNSCSQTTSFTVNVTPQPNIGNLSISSPNATIGLFDTVTVNVQLTNTTDLYSLYMKLKGNAAVNQYLDYSGYTAGTLLGVSNVISTPPIVTNGVPDFGMTKVGAVPGYAGSGLFYTFTFVPKNIVIPAGTTFCFYLDDVSAYNTSGVASGLTNQGQYCYTFTNQLNVWPGDLNNSKTVTTADILPIGYFYNATGPTRTNTSIQWNPQPVTLWGYNHSSQNGDAYKVFADSNGDGVINNADQAAIGFNMNRIHARVAAPRTVDYATQGKQALAGGNLIVTPTTTIVDASLSQQTVTFTVSLNNTGGLSGLYGISVNVLFDENIFDLNTATVDYTGSIFGTAGTDCLVMNFVSTNTVSVGLTRYANAAINGQGLLFKVTLKTKSPLSSSLTQTPVIAIVDAANNQTGDALVVQEAPATNFTIINNLGVETIKSNEFVLYPNPASEVVYLVMGSNMTQTNDLKLKVFNMLGQVIQEMPIQNNTTELSTKTWGGAGLYFVEVTNETNTVLMTKKVIVNRK